MPDVRLKIFFALFFLPGFYQVEAQSTIEDSLLKIYKNHKNDTLGVIALNDLEYEFEFTDFNKARFYVQTGLTISQKIGYTKGVYMSYTNMGWMYKNNRVWDSSAICVREILKLAAKKKSHDWSATGYTISASLKHAQGNYRGAIKDYSKAVSENNLAGNAEGSAIAYNNMGNVYSDFASNDTALIYYNKALAIREKTGNTIKILGTKTNIATVYVRQGKYEKAIEIFLSNGLAYEKLGYADAVSDNYGNASVVFGLMKNHEKALAYAKKAREVYKSKNNLAQIAQLTANIGVQYEALKNYDLALRYYNEAFSIGQKAKSNRTMAMAMNNMGGIYQVKGQYKKALELFQQALAIKIKNNETNSIPLTYHNIASAFISLNQKDSALFYLQKAEAKAEELHYLPDLKTVYKTYSELYEQSGEFDKAMKYYKLFHQYSDSLIDTEKAKKVAELETVFDANKRELDNKRLIIKNQKEKISRIEAEKASARKTKQVYLILIIASVVSGAIIFIYQYRRRKLKDNYNALILKEKEEGIKAIIHATEEERQRIAKDLHDSVGQQMTGLKMAWQQLSGDINKENQGHFHQLVKLTQVLDDASADVRNISHQMMPKVLTEMGLVPAIDDMLKKSLGNTNVEYNFDHIRADGRFTTEIEISLFRICQELVNNIIKHSGATAATIQLTGSKKYLVLIVEDNGTGMKTEKQDGIGMMNIKSRVNVIHGDINYESGGNAGTVATVRIPL
jgi:signal transduction histidine kinase